MKWFRFYHEFVDDPKIAMMSDTDQLLWVKALCLASECKQRGAILLTDEEICWKLRVSMEIWKHAVDKFRAKGMLEHSEGGYEITNWDKRQFASDSVSERVARYREKKSAAAADEVNRFSNVACNVTCNVTETPSDTDTDTDPKEPRSDHSREESQTNSALKSRCVGVSGSFEEDPEAQSVHPEQHSGVTQITSKKRQGKGSKKGLPRLNSHAKVVEYFSRVRSGSKTDKALGQIERLAGFAGFLDWYQSKVCDPCGAEWGTLEEAATAWLSLETSNFLGRGYEDFRQGCLGYLKKHKGEKQIGVRYAVRFLVGGPRCGPASWLNVLESAGTVGDSSAFLQGVDDSHDLEATRQKIGLELARCGRNSVLPAELASRFSKQMASQLNAVESAVYLKWLKSQPSREVPHAV